MTPPELVIVLDFGAQYTQLIARRIRECHVYCEILPYDTPIEKIKERGAVGLILVKAARRRSMTRVRRRSTKRSMTSAWPILGICYGMQAMAHDLGGKVSAATLKEFGKTQLEVLDPTVLFEGLKPDSGLLDEPRRHGRSAAAGLYGGGFH